MILSDAAACLNVPFFGDDVAILGAQIDSRHILPGQLFVALPGARVDGHDYIAEAKARGASCALVSKPGDYDLPHVLVPDVTNAFLDLAAAYRSQFDPLTIALTGSCGKTSVRAMLHSILSQVKKTHASIGNLNNHFGMPLTVFALSSSDQFYVQELGANHAGELAVLTPIVAPDIVLITCAQAVHLSGFGNLAGVVKAKSEIITSSKNEAVVVLNKDDPHYVAWMNMAKARQVISFGFSPGANVRADNVCLDKQKMLRFSLYIGEEKVHDVSLHWMGKHHVSNALAASACAWAAGVSIADIVCGLAASSPEPGRLVPIALPNGGCVIDDSYNASPAAVNAAIDLLSNLSGTRIMVLGDMLELGEHEIDYHKAVGQYAKDQGIDAFLSIGALAAEAAIAFGGRAFSDRAALLDCLRTCIGPDVTVLIKGSHSMRMNEFVSGLL